MCWKECGTGLPQICGRVISFPGPSSQLFVYQPTVTQFGPKAALCRPRIRCSRLFEQFPGAVTPFLAILVLALFWDRWCLASGGPDLRPHTSVKRTEMPQPSATCHMSPAVCNTARMALGTGASTCTGGFAGRSSTTSRACSINSPSKVSSHASPGSLLPSEPLLTLLSAAAGWCGVWGFLPAVGLRPPAVVPGR